jgi:(p)ppGpp synthase/HD superfamily hydrolase
MQMIIEKAICIAAEAPTYQKDKQGQPYILHPLRVMLALSGSEEDMILGVLYDVFGRHNSESV